MLTIFSTCKPMAHQPWKTIQRNAIQSWTKLYPRPEIILIGDDKGVAGLAKKFGCRHVPEVECNQWGTPLLGALFAIANKHATHDQLCYVNADVILTQDFVQALKQITVNLERFLMIGASRELLGPMDFSRGWQERLCQRTGKREPSGVDFFAFSRDACSEFDFSSIAVGRYGWDAWMMYTAHQQDIPVVDVTSVVTPYHQAHVKLSYNSEEVRANLNLTGAYLGSALGYIWGADLGLSKEGLYKRSFRTESAWRRASGWLAQEIVTIFSIPMGFDDWRCVNAKRQENSIGSWTRLLPRPEIILCGNERGIKDLADKYSCIHIPDIEYNASGTPIVSSVFDKAQNLSTYELMCYVNTDIILLPEFLKSLAIVSEKFPQFLMVGQRWNLPISGHMRWDADWQDQLRKRLQTLGSLHSVAGLDYFAFRRGLYRNLPPYVVGRYSWDNGLMLHAHHQGVPVVDATYDAVVVHHDHKQIPRSGEEFDYNKELYDDMKRRCGYGKETWGHTTEATWELHKGILRERRF